MKFLRRLTGQPEAKPEVAPADTGELEADERQHELEILRVEQSRLDELQQRQLRYERYAWQPPAQGNDRRADDSERSEPV
jgi:hypothetical protein